VCSSDLGNAVQLGAWRAIARRDPKEFQEARKRIAEVDAKLDELLKLAHDEADRRRI
jgi:hypothetical protein